MTHDELLATMAEPAHNLNANDARNVYLLALRAVVELHKPWREWDLECQECESGTKYPCPTIQSIEEQLK